MSSELAVQTRALSKSYRITHRRVRATTLGEAVVGWLKSEDRDESEVFWALRDLTLEIPRGQVVGIIGRNGAGKSTLLKILSRVTEPTTGEALVWGRLGSLLEVATGFHPELTGRENIYLNGAVLGMKRTEIARRFDEIVAFAEVDKFLDTPVKHYSSGMYVRLAFAVAAHLDTEVLLVDEVLAVGDAAFQKKCLGKMGAVVQDGRTVVFVSHNLTALKSLCQRAVWLQDGRRVAEGPVQEVVSSYLLQHSTDVRERVWPDRESAPGSAKARLHAVSVFPRGAADERITVRTPFAFEFQYWSLAAGTALNLSISLVNQEGLVVFSSFPTAEDGWFGRPYPEGLFTSVCEVPGDLLNSGQYRLQVLIVQDQGIILSRHDDVLLFEVDDERDPDLRWSGPWSGVVRPMLRWSTRRQDDDAVGAASMARRR
jgi:homopolymeric O-antigen transport system ATP-binding protein